VEKEKKRKEPKRERERERERREREREKAKQFKIRKKHNSINTATEASCRQIAQKNGCLFFFKMKSF
jgi:hypothetical protein